MMTVQKPANGTLIAHRNPHTKRFQISAFGAEIVKAVPDDFKDINEVKVWIQAQGGTMGEQKFYPLTGGYCEVFLPTREQEKAMTLTEKLKAHQRVFVVNPDTGKKFSIEPAYWEGIRLGWTVRNEDGDIAKGYNGIMVDFEVIEDCCNQVVERKTPGVVVEWKTAAMKASAFWHYHAKCLPDKYKIDGKDVRFAEISGVTCMVCNELI